MTTVLIAEPDDAVADLIAAVARDLGFAATRLRRAPEELPPSCVLVVEPSSPVELAGARWLRSRNPALPIVCVSIRSTRDGFEDLGAVAFLVKPFRIADLGRALTEAARASSASA